jgi:hypothetical protein
MPDEMDPNPHGWRRPTWLLLLVAASVAYGRRFLHDIIPRYRRDPSETRYRSEVSGHLEIW